MRKVALSVLIISLIFVSANGCQKGGFFDLKEYGDVEGTIKGETLGGGVMPLEGAKVTVGPKTERTGVSGFFSINFLEIPPQKSSKRFTITVSSQDYVTYRGQVNVPADDTAYVEITLGLGYGILTGKVVVIRLDGTSTPIDEALIKVGDQETRSDSEGNFNLTIYSEQSPLKTKVNVSVSDNYQPLEKQIEVEMGETNDLGTIVIFPTPERIKEEYGEPDRVTTESTTGGIKETWEWTKTYEIDDREVTFTFLEVVLLNGNIIEFTFSPTPL